MIEPIPRCLQDIFADPPAKEELSCFWKVWGTLWYDGDIMRWQNLGKQSYTNHTYL